MQDLPPLPKCLSEANMSFIESDLSLISRIEDTNIPTVLTRKINNLPVNDHPDDEEDDMKQISSANNINRLNKINQDKLNRCQANICSDNNNKTNNASESVNDYCESDMKTSANSLITSNFANTLNNNTYNKSDYHINNSQSNESNDNSDIMLPIKSSDIQLGCTISQVPPALPGSVLDNLIAALRREMVSKISLHFNTKNNTTNCMLILFSHLMRSVHDVLHLSRLFLFIKHCDLSFSFNNTQDCLSCGDL